MDIIRIFKKMHSLGLHKTASIIQHRVSRSFYDKKFRFLAWRGTAHHSWSDITKELKDPLAFSEFLQQVQPQVLPSLTEYIAHKEIDYVQQAERLLIYGISLLGSDHVLLNDIVWHEDVRAKQSNIKNNFFEPARYYRDISIIIGKNDVLAKDIKLPWEFSRFQYLFILGKAFEKTKDQRYVSMFMNIVNNWLDTNHYLRGPNWVCPMDVAIRAINWIVGFWVFKDAQTIPIEFWERFVCSLYDHMIYLEHNWEIYDTRTSNHYLSDLVGYLYLIYFFKDLRDIKKKQSWVIQELCKEFEKQVFFEGADYEGSTCYHGLVTELFYHAYFLCMHLKIKLPFFFIEKLKRMFEALSWWAPYNGTMIQIGDNDSGNIVQGISAAMFDKLEVDRLVTGTRHFDEFGISIIKTDRVHISLRHHAYQKKQPSGHFHNDVASFTFALDGKEVIVDPGTYVYTPSRVWRNRFRSVTCHNTSYVVGQELIPFNEQLFSLDLPGHYIRLHTKDPSIIETSHDLYKRHGVRFHRSITHNMYECTLTIIDWWEVINEEMYSSKIQCAWNFTLSPHIELKQHEKQWGLYHNQQCIAHIHSTLELSKHEGWYSPGYGILQKTHCLKTFTSDKQLFVVTTIMYE